MCCFWLGWLMQLLYGNVSIAFRLFVRYTGKAAQRKLLVILKVKGVFCLTIIMYLNRELYMSVIFVYK